MNITPLFYDPTSRFSILPKLGIPQIIDDYVTGELRPGAIKLDKDLTCHEVTTPAWIDESITLFRDFEIGVLHYEHFEKKLRLEQLDATGQLHRIFALSFDQYPAIAAGRDELYIGSGNTLHIHDKKGKFVASHQFSGIENIRTIARTDDGHLLVMDAKGIHLLGPNYHILAHRDIIDVKAVAWDPFSDTFAIAKIWDKTIDLYTYNKETQSLDFVESRTVANAWYISAMTYDALGNLVVCSKDSIKIHAPDGTCVKTLENSTGVGYQSCIVDAEGRIIAYDTGEIYSRERILIWDSPTPASSAKKRKNDENDAFSSKSSKINK